MQWLLLFLLFLPNCQQKAYFDSQASLGDKGCPISLSAFKTCVKDEFGDIVDNYFGKIRKKSNPREEEALSIVDLLSRKIFQSCGENTNLMKELNDLTPSEASQCKPVDLMSALLTFYDQLILEIANKAIRKILF